MLEKLLNKNRSSDLLVQIQGELEKINTFNEQCSKKHDVHAAQDAMHEKFYLQQEALLKHVISTQSNIVESQMTMSEAHKNMADSILTFSEFVKKHGSNFDIISNIILALGGIRAAVGWLAAVIGGAGVIIIGLIVSWIYLSSPISLIDLFEKLY